VTLLERLDGTRVVICAGSGGVGKTTCSAALALGLAARGDRVAVVTIDPAKRLADALGLDELGNEPHLVDPARFTGHGIEVGGELWAMMLDVKQTFDELIERLAPDDQTRRDVFANRIYQQLSTAVAGSQEFTAVAKLYDLVRSDSYDVIVLDTPPSRNALDFLDAPDRLTNFFEGRALRAFLAPTGLAAKVVGRGSGVVFGVLKRVTGVDLLRDVSLFFRALGGLIDGFRERAAAVKAILSDPATQFLIVTSPEPDPVNETIFFHGKLREAEMPFGGLIVNRVQEVEDLGGDPHEVERELAPQIGDGLARKAAQAYADAQLIARRDAACLAHLRETVGGPEPVLVPQLPGDVHDLDGLVAVHDHLFGQMSVR
jgi:anion-transporting  ArsA/GET3 family ATPase